MTGSPPQINPRIPQVDPKEFEDLRVAVVDNGGQWTHREWRVLRYLGCDARIVSNETPLDELEDEAALVLSGGTPRISDEQMELGRTSEYLKAERWPILGICVGFQFMVQHFGGTTAAAATPEFGKAELTVNEPGRLFQGLPAKLTVWESHNDEVRTLPRGFRVLASSRECPIEAAEHVSRPLMGVQFHPEVEHTQGGYVMFANFLRAARKPRR